MSHSSIGTSLIVLDIFALLSIMPSCVIASHRHTHLPQLYCSYLKEKHLNRGFEHYCCYIRKVVIYRVFFFENLVIYRLGASADFVASPNSTCQLSPAVFLLMSVTIVFVFAAVFFLMSVTVVFVFAKSVVIVERN